MKPEKEEGAFTGTRRKPWTGPRGLEAVLQGWRDNAQVWPDFVLDQVTPARPAAHAPIPADVALPVRDALRRRGIEQLYSHQAEAFTLARSGQHVVVATPTASGKSLCFNLPVLDRFAREPEARALYLFPTKALSRDQEESLRALMREAGLEHGAIIYDGDTPAMRGAPRASAAAWCSPTRTCCTPASCPHHARWARAFPDLRYVVLDELHTYRGVFGSHLANVLRAAAARGARSTAPRPVFIFASATIGNPREHAARMLGPPRWRWSIESGAPARRAARVRLQPAGRERRARHPRQLPQERRAARGGSGARATCPRIVFGQSRNSVEVMLKYLRDQLVGDKLDPNAHHGLPRRLPARAAPRASRRGLRDGEIRCVVATNALELGIDIGALDAVVCAGYPGSVAALVAALRARGPPRRDEHRACSSRSSAPLDQYLAREPEYLLGAPVGAARIDPDNVEILVQHLKCAAFELPFEEGERFGDAAAPRPRRMRSTSSPQHEVVHRVRAATGSRCPLGGRRVPGEQRLAAQRRLGQLRDHRRGARNDARRDRLRARRTRCCTSRPSTSTTASSTRSSASTTRTTRPSCARSSPTTSPTR